MADAETNTHDKYRHAVYTKARSALADSIDITAAGALTAHAIAVIRELDAELIKITERLRAFDARLDRAAS